MIRCKFLDGVIPVDLDPCRVLCSFASSRTFLFPLRCISFFAERCSLARMKISGSNHLLSFGCNGMDMFGSNLAGWGRPVENQEGASLGALLFFLPQLSISACDVGCAPPLRQRSNSANLKLSIGCVVHAVALHLKIYFSDRRHRRHRRHLRFDLLIIPSRLWILFWCLVGTWGYTWGRRSFSRSSRKRTGLDMSEKLVYLSSTRRWREDSRNSSDRCYFVLSL